MWVAHTQAISSIVKLFAYYEKKKMTGALLVFLKPLVHMEGSNEEEKRKDYVVGVKKIQGQALKVGLKNKGPLI